MFSFVQNLPTAAQSAVICGICVAFTLVGVLFFRPIVRAFVRKQPGLNAVLGDFLGVYGVIYGILLGLLAVAAYENKRTIEESINAEGTTLYTLFRNASSLPEPTRSELQEALYEYNVFVVEKEWPQMQAGELAQGATPYVDRIQHLLSEFEPSRRGEEILLAEGTSKYYEFLQQRALRLYRALGRIPGIMWWVVLLGAGINIILLWMFDMRAGVQLVLSGIFAFYLGAVISLIVIMDSPLQGEYGISAEVFELLQNYMQRTMSAG